MATVKDPEGLAIKYIPLDELKPWEGNPKNHDVDAILDSIQTFGFNDPFVRDVQSGCIVEGHGRDAALRQAKAGGHPVPQNIQSDGDSWLVPVIDVRFSSTAEAKAYIIRHNQTTITGGWDGEALKRWFDDLRAEGVLDLARYADDGIDELLAGLGCGDTLSELLEKKEEPGAERKEALEEAQKHWQVKPGDLWVIRSADGQREHRVFCGSGIEESNILRLTEGKSIEVVHCDPPYGISIVETSGTIGGSGGYLPVQGDKDTTVAVHAYELASRLYPEACHIWWGGNYYASHLPNRMCWLVWDKENDGMSFASFEMAWTNQQRAARIFRHLWNGGARASESKEKRFHPTQKPIALGLWVLEQFCDAPKRVLDQCLGSGMTLFAAELHGSVCYGTEIEPLYVAAILQRASEKGMTCLKR